MNRREAQKHIGELVLINLSSSGQYVGKLVDVMIEPKKPWRGKVNIQYVLELPKEQSIDGSISPPVYEKDETVECLGSKLVLLEDYQLPTSFEESHAEAVAKELATIFSEKEKLSSKENYYLQYANKMNLNDYLNVKKEPVSTYIPYTFYQSGSRFLLIDDHETTLDLSDCPFEFKWILKKKEMFGYYTGEGIFTSHEGEDHRPIEGDRIYISKEQFEPYFILKNELDPSSLELLEHNLNEYGLTHHHLIDCHNSLLLQLLEATGQTSFKGVNFLTYRSMNGQVIIQHHYERELNEKENDQIFDRFEITSDCGKRSVVTYVSNMTNKKSL
ncbi:DUF2777 family protein [Bacillus sp. FJAT-45037]|uniref:DUF2777 family protein n=1 Tax=Bacillus sp. FJAT-45037 TaxID=2011007 RepID=UPI000C23B8CD|nr:DUF2777 family protein [Bacillus sp. FJAT-45037]